MTWTYIGGVKRGSKVPTSRVRFPVHDGFIPAMNVALRVRALDPDERRDFDSHARAEIRSIAKLGRMATPSLNPGCTAAAQVLRQLGNWEPGLECFSQGETSGEGFTKLLHEIPAGNNNGVSGQRSGWV